MQKSDPHPVMVYLCGISGGTGVFPVFQRAAGTGAK